MYKTITAVFNNLFERFEDDLDIFPFQGNFSTYFYDRRHDFSFPIVHFVWMHGDVPLSPSYGACISQLVL